MKLSLRKWIASGCPSVDPQKEAEAELERIVNAGKPADEEWAELEERLARMGDVELPPAPPASEAELALSAEFAAEWAASEPSFETVAEEPAPKPARKRSGTSRAKAGNGTARKPAAAGGRARSSR